MENLITTLHEVGDLRNVEIIIMTAAVGLMELLNITMLYLETY